MRKRLRPKDYSPECVGKRASVGAPALSLSYRASLNRILRLASTAAISAAECTFSRRCLRVTGSSPGESVDVRLSLQVWLACLSFPVDERFTVQMPATIRKVPINSENVSCSSRRIAPITMLTRGTKKT
jgi:hypothetical protein